MKKMKKFFKYFIIFLIVYILVDIISYILIKSTYTTKDCNVNFEIPTVKNLEAKCTAVNGYVNGSIENNSDTSIINKYLRIDCYTKRNINAGTKYVKVGELLPGESQEFESKFNYDFIDRIEISMIDAKDVKNVNPDDLKLDSLSNDKINWLLIFGALAIII